MHSNGYDEITGSLGAQKSEVIVNNNEKKTHTHNTTQQI